jgi:hypothetical protein
MAEDKAAAALALAIETKQEQEDELYKVTLTPEEQLAIA